MIHPEDSTRQQAMLLNRHSNCSQPRDSHRNMRRLGMSGASGSRPPTCHSLRRARRPQGELAQIRLHTTAFSKAHNTRAWDPSNKARCNTRRKCHQPKHRDSTHSSMRSIREVSCTACRSHRHHTRHSPRMGRSTDKDQIRHPRHWRPPLGCHRLHNTTLQDKPSQPVQRRQISLRNSYPLNIRRPNPMLRLALQLRRSMLAR